MSNYTIDIAMNKEKDCSLKGYATVVFGNSFKISNLKIVEGSKGLFVSMPQRKTDRLDEQGNPLYENIFIPGKDCYKEFTEAILKEYQRRQDVILPDYSARVSLYENPESNIKGYATLNMNQGFYISGIRIIEGQDKEGNSKLFVSMPSYKNRDEEYKDICHVVTAECREAVNQVVMQEYQAQVAEKEKIKQEEQQKIQKEEPAKRNSATKSKNK